MDFIGLWTSIHIGILISLLPGAPLRRSRFPICPCWPGVIVAAFLVIVVTGDIKVTGDSFIAVTKHAHHIMIGHKTTALGFGPGFCPGPTRLDDMPVVTPTLFMLPDPRPPFWIVTRGRPEEVQICLSVRFTVVNDPSLSEGNRSGNTLS